MRLIRDGEGGGYGDGGRGRLYTYRYAAVPTKMTSALRWVAMRAILMLHNCERQVKRQCPQTTTFEDKEELKQIRTEVLLLTRLTPYR